MSRAALVALAIMVGVIAVTMAALAFWGPPWAVPAAIVPLGLLGGLVMVKVDRR